MSAPWMIRAWDELGTAEVPGEKDNPRIVEYLKLVGLSGHDEIPWCSAFTNWVLNQTSINGTDKPDARSWLSWGYDFESPGYGSITVFWRGSESGWQGHVGFFVGRSQKFTGDLWILGGNQSNRVCVARYPTSRLLGYRWPDYSPFNA